MSLSGAKGCHTLEVGDNGIGMTAAVMSGALLDFGKSYWSSGDVIRDLPGLLFGGFIPTGQFGIGFFSAFMFGDSVKVTSRRHDAAVADTHVLEFADGLGSMPLLRRATADELMQDGGTRVEVGLRRPPWAPDGMLTEDEDYSHPRPITLRDACATVAPALPVSLFCDDSEGLRETPVVAANDWLHVPPEEFAYRASGVVGIDPNYLEEGSPDYVAYMEWLSAGLGEVRVSGRAIGRLVLVPGVITASPRLPPGLVTCGGLTAAYLRGALGVVEGFPTTAARQSASLELALPALREWASEQLTFSVRPACRWSAELAGASICASAGGDTAGLPVCVDMDNQFLDLAAAVDRAADQPEVALVTYRTTNEELSFPAHPGILRTLLDSWDTMSIDATTAHASLGRPLVPAWSIGRGLDPSISLFLAERVASALAEAWGATTEDMVTRGLITYDPQYADSLMPYENGAVIIKRPFGS